MVVVVVVAAAAVAAAVVIAVEREARWATLGSVAIGWPWHRVEQRHADRAIGHEPF